MIFAMSCISLLGSVVWGHHMYTVGLETDTRAYFSGVTILISLPTGTKIFNWLSTYLGNPPLLLLKTNSPFFGLLFLLMFTIGGSTGIILGNAAVDLGLHDTYYVVAHFHFVLSLGAVIAIFSGVIFNGEKMLFDSSQIPGEIVDTLVVRKDVIANSPDTIQALVNARFRALEYLDKNPQDAAARIAPRTKVSPDQILDAFKGIIQPNLADNLRLLDQSDPTLVNGMNKLVDIMVENKLLPKKIDPATLLDPQFVRNAKP